MIQFEETPLKVMTKNYKEFGKFIINSRLLYENELLLKYKKSYAPTTVKRQPISDDFMTVILFLLETQTIDYEKLRELSEKENNLFKECMMKSGLFETLKYDYSLSREKIDDIIEEYEILKGQIEAGNDNPEISDDIKKVMSKLRKYEKISQEEYDEIINEL